MSDLDFVQLTNENDPATCRGRAVHARLAAEESADQDFKRIFRRLAELYDAKASKLEAVGSEVEAIPFRRGQRTRSPTSGELMLSYALHRIVWINFSRRRNSPLGRGC